MPRKAKAAAASRKRASSDRSESAEADAPTRAKRGTALAKFEEFDVSQVLRNAPDPLLLAEEEKERKDEIEEKDAAERKEAIEEKPVTERKEEIEEKDATERTDEVQETEAKEEKEEKEAEAEPVAILRPPSPPPPPPIPQLIPPEPLRDLPEDEEFVPLPAIQVIPSMNRAAEAQNGLLKEPTPPANIQRVTQPGALAPAMPTALMQLLSG